MKTKSGVFSEKKRAVRQLTDAQIFHFFEQLKTLSGAGITPAQALQIMREDNANAEIGPLLTKLSEQLESGGQLSAAVEDSGQFPDYVKSLLLIGEETGKVDDVCGSLSEYYEQEDELRQAIRSAVSYPVLMIGMMFVVVIVLISRVMPVFSQIFDQLGVSAGGAARALIALSGALSHAYIVLIVLFVLCAAAFLYFYFTERGKKQFSGLMARFPLTRRFSEDLALTRFANGMKLTLSAGLDPLSCLELSGQITENEHVREKIETCRQSILSGAEFSEALTGAGLFSRFYAGMISVFARTGSVERAMEFIAGQYRKDTGRRISRVLSAIEPTMVAILSVVVGLILLSVILPLIGVMTNIG